MNLRRVGQLLREYARLRPPERLFSEETAAQLRARLAPSASESGTKTGEPSRALEPRIPATARASPRRRYQLVGAGTAVAAAVILVAVLVTAHREPPVVPGLVVDGAYDKADLFRTTRGEPASPSARGNLFYVGVKVDQPAYVRILVLDDRGVLEVLPLDRSGSVERYVDTDTPTIFGGYEVDSVDESGVASRTAKFVILASVQPVDGEHLSGWIREKNRQLAEQRQSETGKLARELSERYHCATGLAEP